MRDRFNIHPESCLRPVLMSGGVVKEQVERLIESVRGCESGEERMVHYQALIDILRYNEYPKVLLLSKVLSKKL